MSTRRVVVVTALAGAGLTLLAATRPWARAAATELTGGEVLVTGRQAAPGVVAVVLVAAAAALVLGTSGGAARVVAAVALLAAGGYTVVAAVEVARHPARALAPALTDATGVRGGADDARVYSGAAATAWPWLAAAGGVAVLAAGGVAMATWRSWPAPGRRYELPRDSGGAATASTTGEVWDALSRGEDPTDPTHGPA